MKIDKQVELEYDHQHDLEILRAVAQAWHCHSGSSRTANEIDALRLNFKSNPTRFKLEAMNKSPPAKDVRWDFRRSLWDSYEIVSVSKKLEAGLGFDPQFPTWSDRSLSLSLSLSRKRGKESKNSLRNLFNRSSRRFCEDDVPQEEEGA